MPRIRDRDGTCNQVWRAGKRKSHVAAEAHSPDNRRKEVLVVAGRRVEVVHHNQNPQVLVPCAFFQPFPDVGVGARLHRV